MIGFRYRDRRLDPPGRQQRLDMFEQVFAHLLVMLDGDTDRALDQLESIGQRYDLFDDELSPEDVRQHFADRRLIRLETGQGTTSLTSKGEQFVRQRTLDDIFR